MLDYTNFVPYEEGDEAHIIIQTICSIYGAATTFLLLLACFSSSPKPSQYLILSISVADLIFLVPQTFYFDIKHLVDGGFSSGVWGCRVTCFLTETNAGASLLSIGALAIQNYLVIFRGLDFNKSMAIKWVVVIWILSVLAGGMPFVQLPGLPMVHINDRIMLQNGKASCIANFASHETSNLIVSVAIIGFMMVCGFGVVYSYYSIYYFYWHKVNTVVNTGDFPDSDKLDKARRLFFRCWVLSSIFCTMWLPFYVNAIYMVSMAEEPPRWFVSLQVTTVVLNSCVNPTILYMVDPKIRSQIKNYYGFGTVVKVGKQMMQSSSTPKSPLQAQKVEAAKTQNLLDTVKMSRSGLESRT